jgi:hypothetical protein
MGAPGFCFLRAQATPSLLEHRSHLFCPVIEDLVYIAAHHGPVDSAAQWAEGEGVADRVLHAGAGTIGGEGVFVTPERVGPGNLGIDKAVRRIPVGNFGGPARGNAVNTQPVVDTRSEAKFARRLGDAEVQPGRRDGLQVLWAREESKDFGQ